MYVAGKPMPIDEVIGNNEIIDQMTPEEKNAYIQAYQEMYSDMYWTDRFTLTLRSIYRNTKLLCKMLFSHKIKQID